MNDEAVQKNLSLLERYNNNYLLHVYQPWFITKQLWASQTLLKHQSAYQIDVCALFT